MPLPAKLESVPPETLTSLEMKLAEDSLRVKVRFAVPPVVKVDESLETAMVGGVVSAGTVFTVIVTVLLVSDPSALTLPAASAKTPLATLTTPLVVLLAVGVKVAV